MGKKNLKAQLNFAITSCFKGNSRQNGGFGASKHSDMASNQKNGKIYSWSSYHSRVDVACQFSSYVREHYPEVKEARQLTKEMAESFLLSKSATCTTETSTSGEAASAGGVYFFFFLSHSLILRSSS